MSFCKAEDANAEGITTELPGELKSAIENELAGLPAGPLVKHAAALSERYRAGKANSSSLVGSDADAQAYAAYRMPATYAAVRAALREAALALPSFRPKSLLDAGAGPGTASWAALSIWPGMESITLLEREPAMIELGKRLAEHTPAALHSGEWLSADLTGEWALEKKDVVVMSYALGELEEGRRAALVRKLWECTGSLLMIIEPGTPAGFSVICQVREHLTSVGAAVAAPCPGVCACPMEGGNWCHFSARVARSRLHRQAKGAEMAYEDEKFSYIALAKDMETKACEARVLRHPLVLKGHVKLELCTKEGLKSVTMVKSQGGIYRQARDLKWGAGIDYLL